jgi:hypothetical protein
MMIKKNLTLISVVLLLMALFISGCGGRSGAPTETATPTPASAGLVVVEDGIPDSLLAPASSGGGVWVEFPFEGQTMPEEPITFVVVASAAGGVEGISLAINGESLATGQINDISNEGDMSMVRLEQVWQPPDQGQYTLVAESGGASSSVTFCVVACEAEIDVEPSDTPTPAPNVTITPTSTDTPAAAPETEPIMSFWAEPDTIDAGVCTTLRWEVEGFQSVTLNGNAVGLSGSDEECPCPSQTYTLAGVKADGTSDQRTVTVTVNGSCELPDTEPPPPAEDPPADTIGPEYEWTNVVFEDCKFYGQALIMDASGVSWAKFHFNHNDAGWASVWMQDIGGGVWESEVGISIGDGIGTPIGGMDYYIEAADTLTNGSTSTTSRKEYMSCSG